jgi:hypothetical protein
MVQARSEERLAFTSAACEFVAQLGEIGLISSESVTHRYTRCPKLSFRCHDDLPQVGSAAIPSLDGSAPMRPSRSRRGSPTTDRCVVSSPRCVGVAAKAGELKIKQTAST